jgi:hypothetical protein
LFAREAGNPSISAADLIAIAASLSSWDWVTLSPVANFCLSLYLDTYSQPSAVSSMRVFAQYLFIPNVSSASQIPNGEQIANPILLNVGFPEWVPKAVDCGRSDSKTRLSFVVCSEKQNLLFLPSILGNQQVTRALGSSEPKN